MLHADGYLGRYQQGREVPLTLQCTDASGAPEAPLYTPGVSLYRDGSPPALVETRPMPAADRGVVAGLFRLPLFLGQMYGTAGRHLVVFRWTSQAGVAMTRAASFTLNPGGSPDGAVIALHPVERPDGRYLIWQTDAGRLVRGKNPR